MHEIERPCFKPTVEQIIDDELDVGDFFRLEKSACSIEEAFVDVASDDSAAGPDPLAKDPQPSQSPTPDVQSAAAGSVRA